MGGKPKLKEGEDQRPHVQLKIEIEERKRKKKRKRETNNKIIGGVGIELVREGEEEGEEDHMRSCPKALRGVGGGAWSLWSGTFLGLLDPSPLPLDRFRSLLFSPHFISHSHFILVSWKHKLHNQLVFL